jgi:beta-barrel assembly-enhancing protease
LTTRHLSGKRFIAAFLLVLALMNIALPPVAQASWKDILLGGAVEYAFMRELLLYQHEHQPDQIMHGLRREYGVNSDARANQQLDSVMTRLLASIGAREKLQPRYAWFVNNQKEFNAFCALGHNVSVNIGLFDLLGYNEDEVAFVLGHELTHGQRMHVLGSLPRIVTFSMAAELYAEHNPNRFSYIMAVLVNRLLVANYATLPQEKEADQNSFGYAVNAGYNPGAGAAVWARVGAKITPHHGAFEGIVSPNDHPANSQREAYFSQRLTDYAAGKVKVVNGAVFVNDRLWVTPVAAGDMIAKERAYFVAGNLARIFHTAPAGKLVSATEDGVVKIDGTYIMTPAGDEGSAQELSDKLNGILGLAETAAVPSDDTAASAPATGDGTKPGEE